MIDLPDADVPKWKKFEAPYHYEQKAPKKEEKEYPWGYIGKWNVRIIRLNSSIVGITDTSSDTTPHISIPFFGSFS